jgi:hypothetical protein
VIVTGAFLAEAASVVNNKLNVVAGGPGVISLPLVVSG